MQKPSSSPFQTLVACILAASFLLASPNARAANGAACYLDVNGTTGGFGSPTGTITMSGLNWSTDVTGVTAPVTWVASDAMTFGSVASDFANTNFTINLDVSTTASSIINGVVVNSTNVTITLGGSQNAHFNGSGMVVSVPATSTLIWANTRNSGTGTSGGFNMNSKDVTFTGGGTNTFNTYLGHNSTALVTLNGPTLNLNYSTGESTAASGNYSGGFTLTSGTLNFQSAASSDIFIHFTAGKLISFNGGTIDNTSGAPLTLLTTNNTGYSFGGNFAFTGTSSLDLGTNIVALTGSRTLTVNGSTLTVGGIISNSTFATLTKSGAGTLALTAANTYNGSTVVKGGKLVTTTVSVGGGSFVVTNAATLDVKVAAAGQSLNTTNLTLGLSGSDTCSLQVDTGALGNPTAPVINATNLAVNCPVTINLFGTALVPGTFTILTNTPGGRTGAGSFALNASPRLNATLNDDTANNRVTITITATPDTGIVWDGTASGNWDINNSGNKTWKANNSLLATDYLEDPITGNDSVRFDDSATGTTTINLLSPTLSPQGLTVSNTAATATAAYTLNGAGKLSGSTGLLKQGSGTLTLTESGGDNFSGGLSVSNGTLTLDNAASAISGNTTIGSGATLQVGNNDAKGNLPGNVADNGSLIISRSDTPTVNGVISGTGSLANNGSGTVTLTANNSFSGGATLNNGVLQVRGSGGNTGLGGGNTTVNAGGTLVGTNSDAFGFAPHTNPTNILVNGGTVTDLAAPNYRITFPNVTFTGGTLTSAPGNIGDASGNYSFNGDGTTATITTLPASTTATISAQTISPQQNTTFNIASGTTPSGVDLLVSSTITNYTSAVRTITKTGPGVMLLTGAGLYTGNTVISNGVLALSGTASLASSQIAVTNGAKFDVSQLTAGTFTLGAGQALAGNGVVTGNVATVNSSVIDAGLYGGSTLAFRNNLTLADNSTNKFILSTTTSGANSQIAVAGTLDLSAGVTVIQISYSTLQNGVYHLITYGSKVGGVANLLLQGYILGGRQSAALSDTTTPNTIDLVISGTSGNLTWLGDGVSNNWDTNTTPDWSNTVAHAADKFFDGDLVTFNDVGSKSPPVNLTGPLQPGSLVVSNNTGTYAFIDTGTGKISGPTSLLKTGSGALVLTEIGGDDFIGGITVGGGSLVLSNNNVNIAGGILVTGGAATLAYSGTLSGGLSVSNGSATVLETPSGSTALSGGVTVSGGSVVLDQITAPAGNTLIGSGGTLQLGNNDSAGTLPAGSLTMNGALIFNRQDTPIITKVIAGASTGSLLQNGSGTVTLSAANTFTGAVTIAAGILKAGSTTALGRTNTGTTITVGGTLDVNGLVLGQEPITAVGQGSSGQGAIDNSTPTNAIPALVFITLTGNTTFGTSGGRWDLGSPGGATGDPATSRLDTGGQPYKLTKVGGQWFGLRTVTVDPALGDIDVQGGTFNIEGNTTGLGNPAANLFVRSGATFEMFNPTNQVNKQIKLDDGATVFNGAGTNIIIGPITLNGNETFTVTGTGSALTLAGQLTGGGNLVMSGSNTLTLTSAANNCTGNTTVNAGTVALAGSGTVASSAQIDLTGANLDVSKESASFTLTPNTLTANTASTLILSNAIETRVGTFNMNNSVLQLQVANGGAASLNATNLNLGGTTNSVKVTIVGTPTQAQFPIVKYTTLPGGFNMVLASVGPAGPGYVGFISNNVANSSIDFVLTGSAATAVWNGGGNPNFNWSAGGGGANWTGVQMQPGNNLFFDGVVGLNNINDLPGITPSAGITFNAGAGAFVLNGNPLSLTGNVTNGSPNVQTLDLGLNFGANLTLNGGSGGLIVGGGLTNTASAGVLNVTLAGTGTLTNILGAANATGTNVFTSTTNTANWTLMDNASSAPMTLPAASFSILGGSTFNFGTANSAPNLTISGGSGTDNTVGNGTGTSTFNMVNGTLTLPIRINTAGSGNLNISGGTLNVATQIQNANGAATDTSVVTVTGGTLNIGTVAAPAGGTWDLASRGTATANINGGFIECNILDVSRNAATPSVGVVNLNAGTLLCSRVSAVTHNAATNSASGTTATFNFNGGVLRANASSATFFQGGTVATLLAYVPVNAIVKSGGAILDNNGHDITIGEPLFHDSSLGAVADGGLVKLGAGILTLASNNTYTGSTIISNGTLALIDSSSIAASSTLTVEAGATIDVSARTDGTLTLAGGQTLQGNGTIAGSLVESAGSTVSPGASIGVLTVTNSAILPGITRMEVNAGTATNDQIIATNFDFTGGTLIVNNLGGSFTNGETFQLFSAPAYPATSFTTIILPSPGAGLAWQTNLTVDGTMSIVSTGPTGPTTNANITSVIRSGSNLVINGTNNNGGQHFQYLVLSSTNLALPRSLWTPVVTNAFNPDGTFSYTNQIVPTQPRMFFDVKAVP